MKFAPIAVVLIAFTSLSVRADQITYVTPTGAMDSAGEAVKAQATFTTSANTITILLENLIVNQKSVGQNISDLFFTISTGQIAGTLTSGTGMERSVAGNGSFTNGSTTAAGWGLTAGSTFHLDDLNGNAGPAHTIIGLPNGSTYSNANNSITGNGPHNPFLTSALFTLNVPGVTASSKISSATFSFGTESGDNVGGVVVPTPEPATWAIGATIAVAGLLAIGRQKLAG